MDCVEKFILEKYSVFHVSINEDNNHTITRCGANYLEFSSDRDYQIWLKRFKGREVKKHDKNNFFVFTDKQYVKYVPIQEYIEISKCSVDWVLENGTPQQCKIVYENDKIITYFPHQHQLISLKRR